MPIKPSDSEEEYFQKEEIRKLRRAREKAASDMKTTERERLKKQHWMRCPKCGMELAEVDLRGVRVDSCFACGGVFLDSGELEKAIAYKDPGWLGRAFLNMLGADRDTEPESHSS